MIALTRDILFAAMPYAQTRRVEVFMPHLQATVDRFGIAARPLRLAHFLAQVAHESGSLRYTEEIASGDAYEGRTNLGNTHPGDGRRYKGRGLIQLTGRFNYRECGAALNLPLEDQPELLAEPEAACLSAGWYWETRGLNGIADTDDALKVTRRINGGTNGLEDRLANLRRTKKALGLKVEDDHVG
ncbi:glycoside hydrolase family 19 protein [Oleispirillum naphthae]|uniref:glycoside hydrolase family 19 protein n=1 Tax=Oleispirillum naphthae TaxID=2838853 RepID=UPI0030826693